MNEKITGYIDKQIIARKGNLPEITTDHFLILFP